MEVSMSKQVSLVSRWSTGKVKLQKMLFFQKTLLPRKEFYGTHWNWPSLNSVIVHRTTWKLCWKRLKKGTKSSNFENQWKKVDKWEIFPSPVISSGHGTIGCKSFLSAFATVSWRRVDPPPWGRKRWAVQSNAPYAVSSIYHLVPVSYTHLTLPTIYSV